MSHHRCAKVSLESDEGEEKTFIALRPDSGLRDFVHDVGIWAGLKPGTVRALAFSRRTQNLLTILSSRVQFVCKFTETGQELHEKAYHNMSTETAISVQLHDGDSADPRKAKRVKLSTGFRACNFGVSLHTGCSAQL